MEFQQIKFEKWNFIKLFENESFEKWNFGQLNLEIEVFENYLKIEVLKIKFKKLEFWKLEFWKIIWEWNFDN